MIEEKWVRWRESKGYDDEWKSWKAGFVIFFLVSFLFLSSFLTLLDKQNWTWLFYNLSTFLSNCLLIYFFLLVHIEKLLSYETRQHSTESWLEKRRQWLTDHTFSLGHNLNTGVISNTDFKKYLLSKFRSVYIISKSLTRLSIYFWKRISS